MLPYDLSEIFESILYERKILSFLDTLNKKLVIVDKDENIIFINEQATNLLGKRASVFLGKKISDYLYGANVKAVLEKGHCLTNVNSAFYDFKNVVDITPLEINRDIIGAVVILKDLSSDDMMIDTLKLCNSISRELEMVFTSTYDEIIVCDHTGKILKINEACKNIYNMESGDFVGRNVRILEEKGIFNPSVTLRVIEKQKRISITQKTESGKVLIVTGTPIFDSKGRFVNVISMAKDITEIYALKEELSKAQKTAEAYYYELDILRQEKTKPRGMIYKSDKMDKTMRQAQKVARVDSNVLITGESGVGKSMLAKSIHQESTRLSEPFVSINCGAIPETLMESELFGYEGGAFTGARKEGKLGKLSIADKGTLFLDEVSELSLQMQVKLLKAIQEKSFTKVGGTELQTSEFRLIAATNRNLKDLVSRGAFREDLFYRLNVIPIEIPPLRDRKEDIIILVNHFWDLLNAKFGTNKKIDAGAYDVLVDYHWPGNVRELQNCIERIMVTVEKDTVHVCDLPALLVDSTLDIVEKRGIIPLKEAIEEVEKSLILKTYAQFKNTYKTAGALGVSQSTIVRKLKKFGCCDV